MLHSEADTIFFHYNMKILIQKIQNENFDSKFFGKFW